jgi:hypothetical protein
MVKVKSGGGYKMKTEELLKYRASESNATSKIFSRKPLTGSAGQSHEWNRGDCIGSKQSRNGAGRLNSGTVDANEIEDLFSLMAIEEENAVQSLARFRRALRREDQEAIDALLISVRDHWRLAKTTPHLTGFEFVLLAMLIEQFKQIFKLNMRVASE